MREGTRLPYKTLNAACSSIQRSQAGYVNPDGNPMYWISRDQGLSVHLSANPRFALSDERIGRIVKSGVTALTDRLLKWLDS